MRVIFMALPTVKNICESISSYALFSALLEITNVVIHAQAHLPQLLVMDVVKLSLS